MGRASTPGDPCALLSPNGHAVRVYSWHLAARSREDRKGHAPRLVLEAAFHPKVIGHVHFHAKARV